MVSSMSEVMEVIILGLKEVSVPWDTYIIHTHTHIPHVSQVCWPICLFMLLYILCISRKSKSVHSLDFDYNDISYLLSWIKWGFFRFLKQLAAWSYYCEKCWEKELMLFLYLYFFPIFSYSAVYFSRTQLQLYF